MRTHAAPAGGSRNRAALSSRGGLLPSTATPASSPHQLAMLQLLPVVPPFAAWSLLCRREPPVVMPRPQGWGIRMYGSDTPVSTPFWALFPPFFRRLFALPGFLAPRRRERAKDGGKWAKNGRNRGAATPQIIRIPHPCSSAAEGVCGSITVSPQRSRPINTDLPPTAPALAAALSASSCSDAGLRSVSQTRADVRSWPSSREANSPQTPVPAPSSRMFSGFESWPPSPPLCAAFSWHHRRTNVASLLLGGQTQSDRTASLAASPS
eukprot:COSAG04_NODE_148_length_22826_cov_11.360026_13_plen_266_part_00